MGRKRLDTVKSHTDDIAESWARERADLDQTDLLHLIYLMRVGRVLEREFDVYTRREFGISGADTRVIFALLRAGPPYARRPTDLFRALLVTSGAITKQVDRLSGVGLVERTTNGTDGAQTPHVALTAEGVVVANKAIEAVTSGAFLKPEYAAITADDRKTMLRLCRQILSAME